MPTETKIASYCAQCRSRCGCNATVSEGKLIRIEPLPSHPSGKRLCPKGRAAPEMVYHPDRLTQPMRRTSPKGSGKTSWEPISWDQALNTITENLLRIRDQYGAEQVAFSVTTPSGTQISDSISWIERFIRAYGSPNIIYGTEVCNWHKDFASRLTYGSDIGTPDFANTDCIVLWGNNPTATWFARAVEIQKARKRGAKLVVIDPRRTQLAAQADCWLQVKPGTDQAVALGLANLMIEQQHFDNDFVQRWTNAPLLVRSDTGRFLRWTDFATDGDENVLLGRSAGGRLLRYDTRTGIWLDNDETAELDVNCRVQGVRNGEGAIDSSVTIECQSAWHIYRTAAAGYDAARVQELSGVSPQALQQAVDLLVDSPTVAYYAWNGVGQSPTATQTDRAISILYTLTGCYGSSGGNMPGAAAPFADLSGHELLDPTQRGKALGLKERPLGPGLTGWVTARDAYKAIVDNAPYPIRMLYSFGGNLLASQPDAQLACQALPKLEFHVHTDFFLNPSAEYADIVLPAATSWERDALRTGFDASVNGMRRVQLRQAVVEPIGQAKSDTDIVLALAKRLGLSDQFFGGDKNAGRDYVLAPAGLSVAQLHKYPEGLDVSGAVAERAYEQPDSLGNPTGFATPTRRIEVYSERLLTAGYAPVPRLSERDLPDDPTDYPLRLTCAKTVAFCHSQHRTIESLRRLMPDPIIEMPEAAATSRNIKSGDWVTVTTVAGSFSARCKLDRSLMADTVIAQHGWWVDMPFESANMNHAVDTTRSDPVSGSVAMRCSSCQITRIES